MQPQVKSWKVTKEMDFSNKVAGKQTQPTEAEFVIDFGTFIIQAKTERVKLRTDDELIGLAKEMMRGVVNGR